MNVPLHQLRGFVKVLHGHISAVNVIACFVITTFLMPERFNSGTQVQFFSPSIYFRNALSQSSILFYTSIFISLCFGQLLISRTFCYSGNTHEHTCSHNTYMNPAKAVCQGSQDPKAKFKNGG